MMNDVECPTYYFLSFPVITVAEQADACMYQMMERNKVQIVWMKEERFA